MQFHRHIFITKGVTFCNPKRSKPFKEELGELPFGQSKEIGTIFLKLVGVHLQRMCNITHTHIKAAEISAKTLVTFNLAWNFGLRVTSCSRHLSGSPFFQCFNQAFIDTTGQSTRKLCEITAYTSNGNLVTNIDTRRSDCHRVCDYVFSRNTIRVFISEVGKQHSKSQVKP